MGQLLITLYLTQDSFGTAANVSGDNALAILVETFHKKSLLKEGKNLSEVEAV